MGGPFFYEPASELIIPEARDMRASHPVRPYYCADPEKVSKVRSVETAGRTENKQRPPNSLFPRNGITLF